MIPTAFGPYQVVRRLGRGGMGEVWLAIAHGASGFAREVAIKTLRPELAGEPALERALIHEARLAGGLRHRGLVAVLGLGVDDGVTYVVMEYVDGADLASLVAARPLPLPLALLVVEELALALAHVHAARDARGLPLGLVHRDVTPANVLVSRAGEVKLGDFGIAKATALADLTGAGTRKGTYAYMSPEQLAGEPLGPTSDVFSLGAVLAELVLGVRPFDAGAPLATMENVRRGALPALAGAPDDVAAIIRRALAVAPADRHPSAEALRGEVTAARAARPPVALPELAAWVAAARREAGESGVHQFT